MGGLYIPHRGALIDDVYLPVEKNAHLGTATALGRLEAIRSAVNRSPCRTDLNSDPKHRVVAIVEDRPPLSNSMETMHIPLLLLRAADRGAYHLAFQTGPAQNRTTPAMFFFFFAMAVIYSCMQIETPGKFIIYTRIAGTMAMRMLVKNI